MFLFAFEGRATDLTMVKSFFEVCPYKQLSSKHYGNALIDFFELLKKAHIFIVLTTIEGDLLMSNCSSVFDNTTIISIFLTIM
jgi:hypothetical protein